MPCLNKLPQWTVMMVAGFVIATVTPISGLEMHACLGEVIYIFCELEESLIIQDAVYGPVKGVQCDSTDSNLTCTLSDVKPTILHQCSGVPGCAVKVDQGTFGDLCTQGALKVNYLCIPRTSVINICDLDTEDPLPDSGYIESPSYGSFYLKNLHCSLQLPYEGTADYVTLEILDIRLQTDPDGKCIDVITLTELSGPSNTVSLCDTVAASSLYNFSQVRLEFNTSNIRQQNMRGFILKYTVFGFESFTTTTLRPTTEDKTELDLLPTTVESTSKPTTMGWFFHTKRSTKFISSTTLSTSSFSTQTSVTSTESTLESVTVSSSMAPSSSTTDEYDSTTDHTNTASSVSSLSFATVTVENDGTSVSSMPTSETSTTAASFVHPPGTFQHGEYEAACMDEVFSITCPSEHIIVISDAQYGLMDHSPCKPSTHLGLCGIQETREIVNSHCSGKPDCSFAVNLATFLYCDYPGSVLYVKYACISTQNVFDVCDSSPLALGEGAVSSPGYPGHYPTSQECFTSLDPGPSNSVMLSIQDVSLTSKKRQIGCNDYLRITEPGNDVHIYSYCGDMSTFGMQFEVTLDKFQLEFHSDDTDDLEKRGFILSYKVIPKEQTTTTSTVTETTSSKMTTTPQEPVKEALDCSAIGNIDHNELCGLSCGTAPFSLQCPTESVIVISEAMFGTLPTSFSSACNTSSSASVNCTPSDIYHSAVKACSGLSYCVFNVGKDKSSCNTMDNVQVMIQYKCIPKTAFIDVCGTQNFPNEGYISSPNYPIEHSQVENCNRHLTPSTNESLITYNLLDLDMAYPQLCYDKLVLSDPFSNQVTSYCGSLEDNTSPTSQNYSALTMEYVHIFGTTTYVRGFLLHYKLINVGSQPDGYILPDIIKPHTTSEVPTTTNSHSVTSDESSVLTTTPDITTSSQEQPSSPEDLIDSTTIKILSTLSPNRNTTDAAGDVRDNSTFIDGDITSSTIKSIGETNIDKMNLSTTETVSIAYSLDPVSNTGIPELTNETNARQYTLPSTSLSADTKVFETTTDVQTTSHIQMTTDGTDISISNAPSSLDNTTSLPDNRTHTSDHTTTPDNTTHAYLNTNAPDNTILPENTTHTPVNTTGVPDTTTHTPVNTTGEPDTTTHTPVNTTGVPDTPTHTPVNTTGVSNTTTHTPVNTTGEPDTTTHTPVNTTGVPDTTTHTPVNTTGVPDKTTHTPDKTASSPDNTTYTPNNTASSVDNTTYTPVDTTSMSVNTTLILHNTTSTPDNTTHTPVDTTGMSDKTTYTPDNTASSFDNTTHTPVDTTHILDNTTITLDNTTIRIPSNTNTLDSTTSTMIFPYHTSTVLSTNTTVDSATDSTIAPGRTSSSSLDSTTESDTTIVDSTSDNMHSEDSTTDAETSTDRTTITHSVSTSGTSVTTSSPVDSTTIALLSPDTDADSLFICYGESMSFSCHDAATVLLIERASFGLYSENQCGGNASVAGTCDADITQQVISTCSGQTQCTFMVDSTNFPSDKCDQFSVLAITFRCYSEPVDICSRGNLPSSEGLISSPNYPGPYSFDGNQNTCTKSITPHAIDATVIVRIYDLDLERNNSRTKRSLECEDELILQDQQGQTYEYCGNMLTVTEPLQIESRSLDITFQPNPNNQGKGFLLYYKVFNDILLPTVTSTSISASHASSTNLNNELTTSIDTEIATTMTVEPTSKPAASTSTISSTAMLPTTTTTGTVLSTSDRSMTSSDSPGTSMDTTGSNDITASSTPTETSLTTSNKSVITQPVTEASTQEVTYAWVAGVVFAILFIIVLIVVVALLLTRDHCKPKKTILKPGQRDLMANTYSTGDVNAMNEYTYMDMQNHSHYDSFLPLTAHESALSNPLYDSNRNRNFSQPVDGERVMVVNGNGAKNHTTEDNGKEQMKTKGNGTMDKEGGTTAKEIRLENVFPPINQETSLCAEMKPKIEEQDYADDNVVLNISSGEANNDDHVEDIDDDNYKSESGSEGGSGIQTNELSDIRIIEIDSSMRNPDGSISLGDQFPASFETVSNA